MCMYTCIRLIYVYVYMHKTYIYIYVSTVGAIFPLKCIGHSAVRRTEHLTAVFGQNMWTFDIHMYYHI
jgi:hypothetical protein